MIQSLTKDLSQTANTYQQLTTSNKDKLPISVHITNKIKQ